MGSGSSGHAGFGWGLGGGARGPGRADGRGGGTGRWAAAADVMQTFPTVHDWVTSVDLSPDEDPALGRSK